MGIKKENVLAKEDLSEPELILDIDKNLLDDEWLNQPKLYNSWGLQFEDAEADVDDCKREYDTLKEELKEIEAKIDLDIRCNPENYGDYLSKDIIDKGKLTEKMIASIVILHPERKKAQKKLFEAQGEIDVAKHRAGVLRQVTISLEQRKRALERLVDLHGQKYFATPRASENSRDAMGEVERQSVRNRTRTSGKKKR